MAIDGKELLAELSRDVGWTRRLQPDQVPAVLATLSAIQGAVLAQLSAPAGPRALEAAPDDRLLTPSEVAARLGVQLRWLYRHASTLPFTVRLSRRALRFSQNGLVRYLRQHRP